MEYGLIGLLIKGINMKIYEVGVRATGYNIYTVRAESEEEAMEYASELFHPDDYEFDIEIADIE